MIKKFVRIIAVVSLILGIVLTCSTSYAGETIPLNVALVLDSESIDGCSNGQSNFDKILVCLSRNNITVSVFFDSKIDYNGDYASALMKAVALGLPYGIYATTTDEIDNALLYQKYVVKITSRLIAGIDDNKFNEYYTIWDVDIVTNQIKDITAAEKYAVKKQNVAFRVNSENVSVICELIETLDSRGLYILTPTEFGDLIGGGKSYEW